MPRLTVLSYLFIASLLALVALAVDALRAIL